MLQNHRKLQETSMHIDILCISFSMVSTKTVHLIEKSCLQLPPLMLVDTELYVAILKLTLGNIMFSTFLLQQVSLYL